MNLAHLSIARVGNHRKVPRVLTNEERVQAYRAVAPVEMANSVFNYGGGWEPRANTDRANTAPASYRAEGLKPNAPAASTLSTYGANARADAPVGNVPPALVVENSARTDLRPEIAQPGISAGRSTQHESPATRPPGLAASLTGSRHFYSLEG